MLSLKTWKKAAAEASFIFRKSARLLPKRDYLSITLAILYGMLSWEPGRRLPPLIDYLGYALQ
jgi:hypothetical protein